MQGPVACFGGVVVVVGGVGSPGFTSAPLPKLGSGLNGVEAESSNRAHPDASSVDPNAIAHATRRQRGTAPNLMVQTLRKSAGGCSEGVAGTAGTGTRRAEFPVGPALRPTLMPVSDEPSNQTPRPGRASSPFDEPTEQIPVQPGQRSVPRSDDDLGPDPSQTPPYSPSAQPTQQSPSAQPTEQLPTYSGSNTAYTGENTAEQPRTYAFAGPTAQPVETGTPVEPTPEKYRDEPLRRGTTDLGLLVLRVTIGAVFLMHGLQKLTGWWGGPGLDGIESMMDRGGWDQPLATGVLLMVGEIAGGALLILGLASPLAAGALLAVGIDAWLFRQVASPGLQYFNPDGPELETVLVAATTSLILTGPGRISLDGGRGWATRPAFGSFFVLLLAVAAATCTWIFLHGGNPFI